MTIKEGETHCTFNFPEISLDFLRLMRKEKRIPNINEGIRMAIRYFLKNNKNAIDEVKRFGQ